MIQASTAAIVVGDIQWYHDTGVEYSYIRSSVVLVNWN